MFRFSLCSLLLLLGLAVPAVAQVSVKPYGVVRN